MRVEVVNDTEVKLHHERISVPMELWTSMVARHLWCWGIQGGPVLGTEANLGVAIERAMVDLERIALE